MAAVTAHERPKGSERTHAMHAMKFWQVGNARRLIFETSAWTHNQSGRHDDGWMCVVTRALPISHFSLLWTEIEGLLGSFISHQIGCDLSTFDCITRNRGRFVGNHVGKMRSLLNLSTIFAAICSLSVVSGFYLPGVAPHSYVDGEDVDLKVNKLR